MSESPKNLVELYLKSCETFASKPLFGTKKDARGIGSPSPSSRSSSIESAAPWPRRESGPETGSPSSPTTASSGRRWPMPPTARGGGRAHVPGAAGQRMAVHPRRLRCQGGLRRHREGLDAVQKMRESLPALTTASASTGRRAPPIRSPPSWSSAASTRCRRACRRRRPSPASSTPREPPQSPKAFSSATATSPRTPRRRCRFTTSRPTIGRCRFCPGPTRSGRSCELHTTVGYGGSMAINDDLTKLLANMAEIKATILVGRAADLHRIYEAVNHDIAARPMLLRGSSATGIRSATRRANGKRLGPISRCSWPSTTRWCFPRCASDSAAACATSFPAAPCSPRGRRVHRCAGHPGLRGLRSHRDQPGGDLQQPGGTGAWAASAGRSRAYAWSSTTR